MADYKVFNKKYMNFKSSKGGNNDKPREHDYSQLMQKKKQEHDEMFANNPNNQKKEEEKEALSRKSINSFSNTVKTSSKLLNKYTAKIKKEEGRDIIKRAALTLASTALSVSQEVLSLIISIDKDSSTLEQRVAELRSLILVLENYMSLLQDMDVIGSKKSEYKKQCQTIILSTNDMQTKISSTILKTPFNESFEVQESLNTFKARTAKISKAIKRSQAKKPDKMPLMGTEGLS